MLDKIVRLWDTGFVAYPAEMPREEFCPVVGGWSEPVEPEEGSLGL